MTQRQSVYVALTADFEPLYVGVTGCGTKRFHQHAAGAPWWNDVAALRVFHVEDRQSALDLEHYLVNVLGTDQGATYGDFARGRVIAENLGLGLKMPGERIEARETAFMEGAR